MFGYESYSVHQHRLNLKRSKGDSTCAVKFGIRFESIQLRSVSKKNQGLEFGGPVVEA